MTTDDRRVLDVIAAGLASLYEDFPDLPISLPAVGALAIWEKLAEAGIEFRFGSEAP